MFSTFISVIAPPPRRGFTRVVGLFTAMRDKWHERLALDRLDDRLLADIGLTRRLADSEIRKLPWQD